MNQTGDRRLSMVRRYIRDGELFGEDNAAPEAGLSRQTTVKRARLYVDCSPAAALREQAGTPAPPTEQRYIDAQIAPARGALRRMADPAITAGRKLSVEAATAEALATNVQFAPPTGPKGPAKLTRRETDVARLVALGLTNRRIASDLVVSEGTVATHVQHALAKLGLGSREELANTLQRYADLGVAHMILEVAPHSAAGVDQFAKAVDRFRNQHAR
ncbi:MAG: response regulator transcription factor [Chloroflexi bacterium]|nr:response regulator transcription factor [Chloroflexota bacterium]